MSPCEQCKNLLSQRKTPQQWNWADWEAALNLTPRPERPVKTLSGDLKGGLLWDVAHQFVMTLPERAAAKARKQLKAQTRQHATFGWLYHKPIAGRKCQPKTRGEIKLDRPHLIAIALYRRGLGYKSICDKLEMPRGGNLTSLTRLIKGCGGGDKRRAQAGKGAFLADRRGRVYAQSDFDQMGYLEREHDRWWRKAHPKKECWRRAHERMKRTPELKIKFYLRKRIRKILGNKAQRGFSLRTTELIGCTLPELRAHIERQFLPGMTWENRGNDGWHIDHIIPLSSFDLLTPEGQKAANHYTNLQPLWADDNLAKSDRLDWVAA